MSHPCGVYCDLFYYKSPRKAGVVVKALEGREERQGLDLRRWVLPGTPDMHMIREDRTVATF